MVVKIRPFLIFSQDIWSAGGGGDSWRDEAGSSCIVSAVRHSGEFLCICICVCVSVYLYLYIRIYVFVFYLFFCIFVFLYLYLCICPCGLIPALCHVGESLVKLSFA